MLRPCCALCSWVVGVAELCKGPGNGRKNKALWVIGLINMAVLARPVYVDVVCELNNYR